MIIPSFTTDLTGLNELAIRHDVSRNIELGFWGALLVSETATTHEEIIEFARIAVDEAAGRQRFVLQLSFDTIEDMEAMARAAEEVGLDALLMAYPNSFYPRLAAEVTDFTRRVCAASNLGMILFCAPHYNMARIHPSGFPLDVWDQLLDLETVVALKYEVGQPGVVGSYECFNRFRDRGVLICDPFEANLLLWDDLFEVPWVGTSNYEYLGDYVPRTLDALHRGLRDKAVEWYWDVQPARQIRDRLRREAAGANFNHRYVWKYQAWLAGYNGGPLRAPVLKLTDAQMQACSQAAIAAKVIDSAPDPAEFFIGRNPA